MPHADPEVRKQYRREYYRANRHRWIDPATGKLRARKRRKRPTSICPICQQKRKLVWDHCHASEQFRGWICASCNSLLGFAGDDIETLKRAIRYLKEDRDRTT